LIIYTSVNNFSGYSLHIIYEKNLTTGTETKYLYANGFRIAKIVNNNGNETVTYYHHDHLLSTRFLTDQNGNKIEEENYTAFGSAINGITEKYKYTGKEKDITGLYYYGARYYDPAIGRFTTRDPKRGNLMNPQSMNPYVYCMNNPMKYIDPNGETPWDYEWLPDGAVAPDEKRLEEYMNEIESGNHNFDPETERRIREWRYRIYEERTRFYSKKLEPDYCVYEFQASFIGYYVSVDIVLKTETGESELYIGVGKSFGPPTVQFTAGRTYIQDFGDYEGPVVQGGAAYGLAGEVSINPITGKLWM